MATPSQPLKAEVRLVTVGSEAAGQRIDNFLSRHLKGAPRSLIYRLLRTGQVRVNGGRAKPDVKLREGDQVRIPPVRLEEREAPPAIPPAIATRLEAAILYEDADLLVLNKPAGLAVHGGSGLSYGVIEALRQGRPNQPFLELAHRLDRETSGVLLLAKRRETLNELHRLLREGGIEKHYLALLAGKWRGGVRRVDEALARTGRRGEERLVEVSEEGKEAQSEFTPLERYGEATLADVRIDTGRTHQIRVHAAHLGHPVVGDPKYGDFELNRRFKVLGLRRMFLHAARVEFRLPGSGRRHRIEAPLDEELQSVLERLR